MSARLVSIEGFPREGCNLQIGLFGTARDLNLQTIFPMEYIPLMPEHQFGQV